MNFELFVTWVVVGLLTGWMAGIVMKDGGYGRNWDLILALFGSSVASGVFSALAASAETGKLATAVVAFAGAAIAIVGQRKIWRAHA